MALDDVPRLGCGTAIDELWRNIDAPPTAHGLDCQQCQAARASLQRLADATHEFRTGDAASDSLVPHRSVKDAIMSVARAEVRRGRRIPLRRTPSGEIQISEQTIASVIRFAADTVPGVHARRCSIESPGTEADQDHLPQGKIDISLRVSVSSGQSIPTIVSTLRDRIVTVVSAQIGITARTIDVVVEDIYDV
ncbi:Asp23/Gls24 family envelope stress response protein [Saxibacter everestensis]|uniref:Asp23/Gls24 family envelope stress response protein n=1 Tax=Saxibacter everestensis TaxID=2909229 RepID=A0ABY8QVY0_9MICO|nr:Asp23/Gls24 family envelope stress response protein [Brevibacteriaceae bacterium ZFBP1038]